MVLNLLHVVRVEQQAQQKASHEKDSLRYPDLDLAGRLRFALGHDNVQYAVLVRGSNLVHVNLAGELDGSRKVTARLRSLAEPLALGKAFLFDFGLDGEQVVADGDVQILGLKVRNLRLEEEVVLGLGEFQIGLLAEALEQQGGTEVIPKPVEKAIHVFLEPVDLLVFPYDQLCHGETSWRASSYVSQSPNEDRSPPRNYFLTKGVSKTTPRRTRLILGTHCPRCKQISLAPLYK